MLEDIAEALNISETVVIVLLVLVVMQLVLQVAALIDLVRREHVAFNRKWVWVLIILFISNGIGAILYFAVGRQDPPASDDVPAEDSRAMDRAQRAVDLLYGNEPVGGPDPSLPKLRTNLPSLVW